MRKKIAMALLTAAFCAVSSMTAFAMPEQMPDGGVFDVEYYAEENPDVVAVMGNGKDALYQHYTLAGKNEGRLPGVAFDAEYYAANNPDVAAVLGTEEDVLYQHYRLCGKSEGRLPSAPGTELKPLKSSAQTTPATPANPAAQPQAGGIQGTFGEKYTLPSMATDMSTHGGDKMVVMEVTAEMEEPSVVELGRLDSSRFQVRSFSWTVKCDKNETPVVYWDVDVERSESWTGSLSTSTNTTQGHMFTVRQDGVIYPECEFGSSVLAIQGDYWGSGYFYLPLNYDGTVRFIVYASKPDENGKSVKDEQNYIYYVIK